MQVSGTRPAGALRPGDVTDLAPLFEAPGPFLSVVLATPGAMPQAAQQNERRWDTLREGAAASGAPETALARIDPLVADAHRDGASLAVFADEHDVLLAVHDREEPRHEYAVWAPLPRLAPVLESRQKHVPFLLVLTDREGADLVVVGASEDAPGAREEAGGGRSDAPIRKVRPGGWSQRRYQQRAENTWRDNAHDVAERITQLVDRHDLAVVVVAGDVRAVELLEKALPARIEDRLQVVEGSRAEGGRIDEHDDAVRRVVATEDASRSVALLHKFEEELGQADRAANGPADTFDALMAAQVDVLLVHDDPSDDRVAWYGDRPLDIATNVDDLRGLGVDNPREARLVDVALRAAFGSGASIRVVPHARTLSGAIGALLRWS